MANAIEFTGTINGNGIVPPAHYSGFLRANTGKQARISLSWHTKRRTLKQNSFWFGPVLSIVREWMGEQGYNLSAEETHDYLVKRVWKHTKVAMIDGEAFECRLSSTRLSAKEWEEKIELTRQWAAEHGFIIPYPHEDL